VRHRAAGSPPADPPVSGSLPLLQPSLPQPRDRRPAPPLFPAVHGSLPLDDFGDNGFFADNGFEAPLTESRADQAARRTRVSLATPAPRCTDVDDEDIRIYPAPPIGGLGGFTIGSVPASVTPPKTWRKAAWFATGASGELRAIAHAGSTIRPRGPDAIRLGNDPIGAPSRAESCSESCANARARESGRAGPVPPRVLRRASPDPDARVLTASTVKAPGGESRPQTCKLQRFHSVGRDRTGERGSAKFHAATSTQFRRLQPPER